MRSVSSKMYRMRQCALRPRPVRSAPPRATGCFLAFHLETPAERGLPGPRTLTPAFRRGPQHTHARRDAGPGLPWPRSLPGPGARGEGGQPGPRAAEGGGQGSWETGRPGSRVVGSPGWCAPRTPPPALARRASRQPDFGGSERFLRASKHILSSSVSKRLPLFLLTGS